MRESGLKAVYTALGTQNGREARNERGERKGQSREAETETALSQYLTFPGKPFRDSYTAEGEGEGRRERGGREGRFTEGGFAEGNGAIPHGRECTTRFRPPTEVHLGKMLNRDQWGMQEMYEHVGQNFK